MTEKNYYTKLGHYYAKRAIEDERTIVWEAKITKTGRLSFSALQPHQEEKMLEAERSLNHKIPDVGRLRKPFDGVAIFNAYCVIPVIFFKPRDAAIYEMSLRDFIWLREQRKSKSLTEDDAIAHGRQIFIK